MSHRMLLASALLVVATATAGGAHPAAAFRDCKACPQMTLVPAGSYEMGASPGDTLATKDELPRHRVDLRKPFAVGTFEVTRGEFAAFVAATGYDAGNSCNALEGEPSNLKWQDRQGRTWRAPGYEQTDRHPVVCVSWNDAQAYARWLTKTTGKAYRLLSEAEWEYVARSGLAGPASHDTANYGAEAESFTPFAGGKDRWLQTAPVGSFPADSLGLYDVRGNVWEWIEDCFHEDYAGAPADGSARTQGCSMPDRRSVRGGGWGDSSKLLRPSYRLLGPASARYFSLGFRVARDAE